ncbi:MAG: helix-turn-helix domain-containing protein [Deltaproteobacteria bacterium]
MEGVKGGLYLGGEGFIEKLNELLDPNRELDGVPRYQRHAGRPSLSQLFKGVSKLSLEERNVLIIKAVMDHGYSQAEVASSNGLHDSTVSRIAGGRK